MKLEALHAHVERLLEQITGVAHLTTDDKGMWPPLPQKHCVLNVTVRSHEQPQVFVYAVAALDVPEGPTLFTTLNTLNSRIAFCRIYWLQGSVLVETELLGDDLSREELTGAMLAVARTADTVGPQLVGELGGKTPVTPQADGPAPVEPDPGTGLYL